MRKVFAAMLALAMVLSLPLGALAAETGEGYVSESRVAEVSIKKLYTLVGAQSEALYPRETLTFTSTQGEKNPDDTNLTIAPLTVAGNSDQKLVITLPSYSKVGTYRYTITEDVPEQKAQGVVYSDAKVEVTVLVTYDYENQCLQSQVVLGTGTAGEGKLDTFTNRYDLGTMELTKTVTGNLGDQSVYFDIHVRFHSVEKVASDIAVSGGSHESNPTVIGAAEWKATEDGYVCEKTFHLKHSDTLTFGDVPAGVSYTVVEDEKHLVGNDGFDVNSATDTDYSVTYEGGGSGQIAAAGTARETVVNEKKTTVETGVLLDSMPYLLMFTAGLAGVLMLLGKKRYL